MPIFFEGQNSRLFQLASHVSLTLRRSLLLGEARSKIGSVVRVRIGAPVPFAALAHIADRKALADHLRRATDQFDVRDDLRGVRDFACASGQARSAAHDEAATGRASAAAQTE